MTTKPTREDVEEALRNCGDSELLSALDNPEMYPDDIQKMLDEEKERAEEEIPDLSEHKKDMVGDSDNGDSDAEKVSDKQKTSKKKQKKGKALKSKSSKKKHSTTSSDSSSSSSVSSSSETPVPKKASVETKIAPKKAAKKAPEKDKPKEKAKAKAKAKDNAKSKPVPIDTSGVKKHLSESSFKACSLPNLKKSK